MPKVTEVRDIPLDDLVIGKGQVRIRDVGKDIEDLAESIRIQGLLEPIVVAPTEKDGKYEILIGQRRYLAHRQLKWPTIRAAILDERVDETTAKVLSLTENLMRRDPNTKDLIDVCTALYKRYGTAKAVAEETGLPYSDVNRYVKYDRLQPELRQLVDAGAVTIQTALRAQDASMAGGEYKPAEAVALAKEMAGMSGVQQQKIVKTRQDAPDAPVDEVIENAKSGGKVTQVIVTLGSEAHRALQDFAKSEGTNQDDAAATLITDGLSGRGFLAADA